LGLAILVPKNLRPAYWTLGTWAVAGDWQCKASREELWDEPSLPLERAIFGADCRGKYQGFTIAKWLPDLIYEYYRLSSRHERTGRPFKETLDQLGLEEFRPWSQEASQL
jgi:hypothetical protein